MVPGLYDPLLILQQILQCCMAHPQRRPKKMEPLRVPVYYSPRVCPCCRQQTQEVTNNGNNEQALLTNGLVGE